MDRYERLVTMQELMDKIINKLAEIGESDDNANKLEREIHA